MKKNTQKKTNKSSRWCNKCMSGEDICIKGRGRNNQMDDWTGFVEWPGWQGGLVREDQMIEQ